MMKKRPTLTLCVVVLILGLVLLAIVEFGTRKPTAFPPLPNPNGYDDFVQAGNMVVGEVGLFPELDVAVLRGLVVSNAAAVTLLDQGLTRTCLVPAERFMTNVAGSMGELAGLKRLGLLLAAQARLAELEQQTNAAALINAKGIRYGSEVGQGGFLIHERVGTACKAIALAQLERILPAIECDSAGAVIHSLEATDAAAFSWSDTMRNERIFDRNEVRQNFFHFRWVVDWWQTRGRIRRFEVNHKSMNARLRLIMTELALRCYQGEQGKPAPNLDSLVPEYLQRVPRDPFGDQQLIYCPSTTNWLVYSVGPDGRDDGGARLTGTVTDPKTRGDIFLDSQ